MNFLDEVYEWICGLSLGFLLVIWTIFLFSLGGCANPPPHTIEVSSALPDSVREGAYTAAAAWCTAPVHWCPELVESGADATISIHGFVDSRNSGARAKNTGEGEIWIQPDVVSNDWNLSGVLTHEFGHFGIDGHVPSSALMHAVFQTADDIPTTVDTQAAVEWCRQQGC